MESLGTEWVGGWGMGGEPRGWTVHAMGLGGGPKRETSLFFPRPEQAATLWMECDVAHSSHTSHPIQPHEWHEAVTSLAWKSPLELILSVPLCGSFETWPPRFFVPIPLEGWDLPPLPLGLLWDCLTNEYSR